MPNAPANIAAPSIHFFMLNINPPSHPADLSSAGPASFSLRISILLTLSSPLMSCLCPD
jgi:hypothetical protein